MYCGAVSGLKTTWMRGRSWEVRWSYSSGRYDNDCLRWHRMASGTVIVQCTVWASQAPPLIPLPPAWNKVLDSAVSLYDLHVVSFRPMTHSSETSSITWLVFWHRFLVCVSCRTGFFWYQIPSPVRIRTLFCSKPEGDWNDLLWLVDENCWRFRVLLFVYLSMFSAMFIFGARNFTSDAHGTKNRCLEHWRWKPAPENGVGLWCQFLERVSWTLGLWILLCYPLGELLAAWATSNAPLWLASRRPWKL